LIRRTISVLLFVLGGWMLFGELFAAFFDVEPGLLDSAIMVGIFIPIAGAPLLAATLLTPRHRWRELGLTILLAAGIGILAAAFVAAVMLDPAMARLMPPLRELRFDAVFGFANLLVVSAVGLWLYRRTAQHPDQAERE